jgi:hypothetical protein
VVRPRPGGGQSAREDHSRHEEVAGRMIPLGSRAGGGKGGLIGCCPALRRHRSEAVQAFRRSRPTAPRQVPVSPYLP